MAQAVIATFGMGVGFFATTVAVVSVLHSVIRDRGNHPRASD